MLRRTDPIREAAERLRKTVQKDRGKQGIQPATVIGVRGKEDRDVIECELESGEIVNAIAHGQGEFGVGQVVYLERLYGKKGRHWLVVTSASPPDGTSEPPSTKAIQLHKGKPKGVKRIPPANYRQLPFVNDRIPYDSNSTLYKVQATLADGTAITAVYNGPHARFPSIGLEDTIKVRPFERNRYFQWRVPETVETDEVDAVVTEAPVAVGYELNVASGSMAVMKDMQAVLQLTNTNATFVQARIHLTKEMGTDSCQWWIFAFEDTDGDGEFADEFTGRPNWGFPVTEVYVNDNGEDSPKILEGYGDLTETEAVTLITKDYFVFVVALLRVGEGYVKRNELPLIRKASLRLLDDTQYQAETGNDPWPFENDEEVPL